MDPLGLQFGCVGGGRDDMYFCTAQRNIRDDELARILDPRWRGSGVNHSSQGGGRIAEATQSPSCPAGIRYLISPFGLGATMFAVITGVSGNVSIGVALPARAFKTGSLRGTQLYGSGVGSWLFGLGAYAGAGENFGFGAATQAFRPGFSRDEASWTLHSGVAARVGGEYTGTLGPVNGGPGALGSTVQHSGGLIGRRQGLGGFVAGGLTSGGTVASEQLGCEP